VLLLQAHEQRAWAALGYPSWAAYIEAEFSMSRSRSYQLIHQARVIKELEAVAGVSTSVDISEAATRDRLGDAHGSPPGPAAASRLPTRR
jgi:hypothetical protein